MVEELTPEEQELKNKLGKYADKVGIKFNPNKQITNNIIKRLIINRKEKKEAYCPCRITTGNKEKDKEIICPCVYHRGEIELQGYCHCNLFVKI